MSIPSVGTTEQPTSRSVLSVLEGTPCPTCDAGVLERGTYKDNQAIICDTCAVPRVQIWS